VFKKIKPTEIAERSTPQFPHCDPRILHAPTECEFCDMHPEWQQLRTLWRIAFTGYEPEGTELPCPADYARGDKHTRWHGNVAAPVSPRCEKADGATRGKFSCTRDAGHDGPCAAVPTPTDVCPTDQVTGR
jgi:hypothetical protein